MTESPQWMVKTITHPPHLGCLAKGPGGFPWRGKALAGFPGDCWSYSPQVQISVKQKPPTLILVKTSGSFYASSASSCSESKTLLRTAAIYWHVQSSQWESEIAPVKTQANKSWVPGISQTPATGPTCLLGPISSQTTLPFALYAPDIVVSTYLKHANLFPPQGPLTWPSA